MKRTFAFEVLLTVVSLGLYLPYRLWERNRELRQHHEGLDLGENVAWVASALVLTILASLVSFPERLMTVTVQTVAILAFSVGVLVLLRNGKKAADATQLAWRMPPWPLACLVAAAFLALQAGDVFPSLYVRVPALLLLASLPFLFFRVWEDLDALVPEAPPASSAPTS